MTTPAQAQQQPTAQEQQILAITVAAELAVATSAAAAEAVLWGVFSVYGMKRQALRACLTFVMASPPAMTGVSGPATAAVTRLNHARRAQFVIASVRRLTADLTTASAHGDSLLVALQRGLARERRYYQQHLDAAWNRSMAAAQADLAYLSYGPLLGWYATMDSKTSAECRAADGKNFTAEAMPLIGYPGMVHPHCRCRPGQAHAGASMLPSRALAVAA
jgi:hypothetical protein